MRSLGIISDLFLQKDFTHKKKHKKYKMQTSDIHSDVFIRPESIKKQKQATLSHK